MEFLVAVLSARPDSVSNFVKVDSIFGPVMADSVVTSKACAKGTTDNANASNRYVRWLVSGLADAGLL